MKFFLIVIVFTFYFDCYAQTKFKTVVDEKKNQPMLIGVIDRSNLMDSSFIHWFNEEYEYYAVDTTLVKTFKDELENVKITIVMGTWCSDSRREVPHLLKIFDFLNFPKESYEIKTFFLEKNMDENLVKNLIKNVDLVRETLP